MAYQEYTITTLADIPSLVAGFAATLGWDVQAGTVLRHPNFNGAGPGGLAFKLTAQDTPEMYGGPLTHKDLFWTCTTDATKSAGIRAPVLATEAAPTIGVVQSPTKLFLIGLIEPEPYIAIVVEFGYNLYRHLYLGYMEKQGIYTGGAVISGCSGPFGAENTDVQAFANNRCTFLFRGHNFSNDPSYCYDEKFYGGVEVNAAENAVPWRKFFNNKRQGGSGNSIGIATGAEAFGGFGDGINDPYVAKGQNRIAGAVVLSPINLYISRMITGNWRLRGIGRPAGVRMVNIKEMEPQASFSIADDNFYSFAARSKNNSIWQPRPGNDGRRYRLWESTYFLGYAYKG